MMDFRDWEPEYVRILRDFGYSREEDERAAIELASLAADKSQCDEPCLARIIGKRATVVAGPPMSRERFFELIEGTLFSVGIGTSLLMRENVVPDLVVTDMDGDVATDLEANGKGAVLVVHAHGDNVQALRQYVPLVEGRMVLTTQSIPFGRVHDFGGFTDGDRAVALAAHFGARDIRLIGFDLQHPRPKIGTSPEIKAKKLIWAERLINRFVSDYGLKIEYR
jgi:2-amino-4-hydroxy-6-hydroxymethyldihydropteridine diphosphokinase